MEQGFEFKVTMPKMDTPLRVEIKEGINLKPLFNHMQTPLRKEIEKVYESEHAIKRGN